MSARKLMTRDSDQPDREWEDAIVVSRLASELVIASWTTIALRSWKWMGVWQNPGLVFDREWSAMMTEKAFVSAELVGVMQKSIFDLWMGDFCPWNTTKRVIHPLHRDAVANARRLSAGSKVD
ncbi:MAG: hypothetical protein GY703_23690 [Gammaproteobacteria bacterium]|nr:hypothetical protein [Gammaproteobacteria bacterium]